MPLTGCDSKRGKLADASRWLSVTLAAISQKADLGCESAALQVLLSIYITNNFGPAHFVTMGVCILCPPPRKKISNCKYKINDDHINDD